MLQSTMQVRWGCELNMTSVLGMRMRGVLAGLPSVLVDVAAYLIDLS